MQPFDSYMKVVGLIGLVVCRMIFLSFFLTFFYSETIYSKQTKQILRMAQRFYRELSDETKQKISSSMKQFHKNNNGTFQKQQTSQKQSQSMKDYWRRIPHKPQSDDSGITSIEDIML